MASRPPTPVSDQPRTYEYVKSLERGLSVIKAFDATNSRLTLSDVARRTGLTRAAARRFLHTLVEIGYVSADDRHFVLRPRVLELGHSYLSSLGLKDVALPHLEKLSRTVEESSSAAVLDGMNIVYVARVASRRIMSVDLGVGAQLPSYATSMGRVLLAALPLAERASHTGPLEALTEHTITDADVLDAELARVGEQGWSIVDEELEEGLRSVAAPVHDHTGRVVAAINVSAPARQGSVEDLLGAVLPVLQQTVGAIDADLELRG